MKMSATRRLTECAMLIALATGLSMVKLVEMPAGGSVTAASMLPIVLLAYRHGTKYGLLSGLVYGVLQQLLGLKTLSYVTGWASVLAVLFLDYVIAFAVIGFAGIFRRAHLSQAATLSLGAAFVSVLRYICHVISGATVWVGLSIPNEAALLYSLGYNATFMIPETVILVCAAAYLGGAIDFRQVELAPIRKSAPEKEQGGLSILTAALALVLCIAVVAVTVTVFPYLQGESGTFDLSGAANIPWLPVGICIGLGVVSLVGLCICRLPSVVKCVKNHEKL
ncbi:MAG: energy-coupled thiamine transporter ThiT [Clostridia bacterium]|nr:energy-coupled thiamine transporter ThiT [Clostridia bacterium]